MVGVTGFEPAREYSTAFQMQTATKLRDYTPFRFLIFNPKVLHLFLKEKIKMETKNEMSSLRAPAYIGIEPIRFFIQKKM